MLRQGTSCKPRRARSNELGTRIFLIAPPAGGAFGWPGVASRIRERPIRALHAGLWVAAARHRLARIPAIDRTIAHWALPSAWPIGLAGASELDVVSHGGDVRLLLAFPRAMRSAIARAIVRRARVWRFVSEPLLEDVLRSIHPDARALLDRVATVEPATLEMPDVHARIGSLRERMGARRVAACVGRLVASKRMERAIEYVAASDAFDGLVVVGDGPEQSRLERLARSRHVDAQFLGVVDRSEALAWIGAAHALLHASDTEGASSVVREARALGTPVVVLGGGPGETR